VARAVAQTPDYRRTRRQRKQVEMLFAHMKRVLKMDRLRLRGIKGAQDEFLLTATAQNLRRMAKYLSTGPPGVPEKFFNTIGRKQLSTPTSSAWPLPGGKQN
jgi:hypothetical protein